MTTDRVVIALTAPSAEARRATLARARRRGFRRFATADPPEVEPAPGEERLGLTHDGIVPAPSLTSAKGELIPVAIVSGPSELPAVAEALRRGRPVGVRWRGERILPLETLVAARATPGTLWVVTDRATDVPAALGALEHGADAVVVECGSPESVDEVEALLDSAVPALAWELAPVTRVAPAGVGDRVIVDTTSLLAPDEGLLVGSAARFLFLVASEAVGSRYTRPRPFRVNAGSAHLYTLLANGETRYLSELVPGDSVLAAGPTTGSRAVRVGRVKIERRPLVLVEAEHGSRRYTVFVQEAETVRLSGERAPVPVTEVAPGTRVRGVGLAPARHLGVAVAEAIDER